MNFFAFSALLNAFSSLVAGIFIFRFCRISRLRWTYIFFCASVFWWSGFYFFWQLSTQPNNAMLFCRLLMIGAIFVPISNLHHLIVLLDAEKRHAALLKLLYLLDFFWVIITAYTSLIVKTVMPISGFRYWPVAGLLFTPFLLYFTFTVLFAIYLIMSNLFIVKGIKRTQLLYVLIGTLIGWVGAATNFPLWYGIHIPPAGNGMVSAYIFCVGYGIVKHRLMDISVIVRKTLVYTMVMAPLAVVYIVSVAMFTRLFEGLTRYQTVFTSTVAAGLIAFCFQPLRKRVQKFVDQKFFRQYVDRDEKLYELSREVITHTTPEAMGGALMHVLNETLHPKGGALFLRSRNGGGFTRISSLNDSALPDRMEEENELASYFKDHPQPFIQNTANDIGKSLSTRSKADREAAA